MLTWQGLAVLMAFVLSQTTANKCDAGWDRFGSSCFKKFEAKLTFEESAQKCHSFGSELASFHYRREFDFLVALCDQTTEADDPTQSTTPFCWIGILSDGIPKIDVPVYEKNRFKLSFVDGSEVPEFPGDDEYSHYWGHTHAHGHEPNGYIQPDSRRVDRCVRLMQSNSILYPKRLDDYLCEATSSFICKNKDRL